MLGISILAALVVAQAAPAPLPACSGNAVSIESVANNDVQNNGDTERYALRGTVINHGTRRQTPKVLQSVEVYQDGQKINEIGVPPLGPGRSYTFRQSVVRSVIGGEGTTHLTFRLEMHQPQSCAEGAGYRLRV
jgi:hypothetical protein